MEMGMRTSMPWPCGRMEAVGLWFVGVVEKAVKREGPLKRHTESTCGHQLQQR